MQKDTVMNKVQVEKHYDVIRWWLDNPDKGVLYRQEDGNWRLAKAPTFAADTIYIQNDEYAKLRKALADGKTIQIKEKADDSGVWVDLFKPNFMSGDILEYSIKIELDWRDAFIDSYSEKTRYSNADVIRIKEAASCNRYKALCAYVSQFDMGGFWYDKKYGLYFVTNGSGESDPLATYEHAMKFIKEFKSNG